MEGEGRDGNGNSHCECSKTKSAELSVQVKNEDFVKRHQSLEGDEKICRICHLGSSELIQLGCGCKGELGVSHLPCAQIWFKQKGNRLCEICRKTAINVSGVEDINSVILLVEWDEMRLMAAAALPSSLIGGGGGGGGEEDSPDQCKRTFRNILMACLVLAFVVPWLFRINMF